MYCVLSLSRLFSVSLGLFGIIAISVVLLFFWLDFVVLWAVAVFVSGF